jgi:hypothetical protein
MYENKHTKQAAGFKIETVALDYWSKYSVFKYDFLDLDNESLEKAGTWEGELAKLYGISFSEHAFAF